MTYLALTTSRSDLPGADHTWLSGWAEAFPTTDGASTVASVLGTETIHALASPGLSSQTVDPSSRPQSPEGWQKSHRFAGSSTFPAALGPLNPSCPASLAPLSALDLSAYSAAHPCPSPGAALPSVQVGDA
jgi:hypothetical protein